MTNDRRHQLDLWAIDGIKPTYTPYHETSEMVYYFSAWILNMAKMVEALRQPHINACMRKIESIISQIELHERIFEHQAKSNVEFNKVLSQNKDLKSKSKGELIKIINELSNIHLGNDPREQEKK